jgi:hypothetical protein
MLSFLGDKYFISEELNRSKISGDLRNYFKLNNWKRLFSITIIGILAIQNMKIALDYLLKVNFQKI